MPPSAPPSVSRNVALLSAGTLLSRVLGMARETLIAATFSIAATDAFFLAWRIPNALRALLAEGALSAAFVPVFSSVLERGADGLAGPSKNSPAPPLSPEERERLAEAHRDDLREAVARVRAASLAVLVPVTLLGMLLARPILGLLAGDFHGSPATLELSVGLLRVLFPYLFFMGSAAVGIGVLQSLGRMKALAFAPALLNVSFLLAPFLFIPLCKPLGIDTVYGLAAGALLGGALQLLAIVPDLRRERMLPWPRFEPGHPAVRRVASLLGPTLFGTAIYQIDVMVSSAFLADSNHGLSFFNYAQRLADIPQGVFIVSITSSYLPELSRAATRADHAAVSDLFGRMLRLAGFVAIPVAVILATYGEAIVPLVFGYGRFRELGHGAVMEVVHSLRWQAANVALAAFVRQYVAVCNASQNTRTPVLVSALDLVAFVLLAYWLREPMGHPGVAAAISGSTLVQLALLVVWSRHTVTVPWRAVLPNLARVVLASAIVGICARIMVGYWDFTRPTLTARTFAIAGGTALGTVYLLAAWLLQIEEVTALREKVLRRLRRRR